MIHWAGRFGTRTKLHKRFAVILSLLTLVVVYAIPNAVAQQTVTEQDSMALVAFYIATDGENWNENSGWLQESVPVKEWVGVSIFDERVVKLELEGKNVNGVLPSVLADLTYLDTLHLRDNNISGEVPSEFAGLTNLKYLNLRDNEISGSVTDLIPVWENVTHIDFRGNKLSGELPSTIDNLTNIEVLVLRQNNISGQIPPELGNVTSLQHLELGENNMTGEIPFELSNLVNLERLELDEQGGPLTGAIPSWIGNLEKLERLRLERNDFTGEIPSEIGNLHNLERIDLQRNSLEGEIPKELGQLANSLERLSLGENNFTPGEIPDWMESLQHLTRLEMEETNLTGEVPGWIGDLTHLERLYFEGNADLNGPLPMSLINLVHMERFSFNDTGLCEPDDDDFREWLDSIDRLDKSGIVCEDSDPGPINGDYTAYRWDQTHVDTQWLIDANENNNLTVETVTNLNAGGPGSLAQALLNAENNENTLVVFEVGGVLDNEGTTFIRSYADNVYIAGQTAPWPGITIIRGGLRIHGNRTIVQHLSILTGDEVNNPDQGRAAVLDAETHDIIFDHVTAGWSPDTNVNFRQDATRHAFINGINAEPLNVSSHSEGNSPTDGHGYGLLHRHNNSLASYMGVLHVHSWKRNPAVRSSQSTLNWINVYTYNWGARHYHGWSDGSPQIDWIGNVAEAGPDTRSNQGIFNGLNDIIYYSDNIIIGGNPLGDHNMTYSDEPLNLPAGLKKEDIVPAEELEQFLISVAGARPADRAPVEQRIIQDFTNREGRIINSFEDHPEYPNYRTTSRFLNPPDTDLLDWLQHYSDEVVLGIENPLHEDDGFFITLWQTGNDGASENNQIIIPGEGSDYKISWAGLDNDHEGEETGTDEHTITFPEPGKYRVEIGGDFTRINFGQYDTVTDGDNLKIVDVVQWGNVVWSDMSNAFRMTSNLDISARDTPDLSEVTSTQNMFRDVASMDIDIGHWHVSNVTDMSGMFWGAASFNQDIGDWDVSNVIDMSDMFHDAASFNRFIGNWDVSSVTDMSRMFRRADSFSGGISRWDTGNVIDMTEMFSEARSFNINLGDWDVSSVEHMDQMLDESNLSVRNYDLTLTGWSSQDLKPDVTLGASGLYYCEAEADRQYLIDHFNWTIVDEGVGADCEPTSVENPEVIPDAFALHPGYPNPFNPAATIPFDLPEHSNVRLEVYNMLGHRVAVLTDQIFDAGRHTVSWDASSVSSGVYVVRMTVTGQQGRQKQFTQQLTLLK